MVCRSAGHPRPSALIESCVRCSGFLSQNIFFSYSAGLNFPELSPLLLPSSSITDGPIPRVKAPVRRRTEVAALGIHQLGSPAALLASVALSKRTSELDAHFYVLHRVQG